MGTELTIDEGLRRTIWAAFALETFPCGTTEAVGCHPAGFDVSASDTIGSGIRIWIIFFVDTTICALIGFPLLGTSLRTKLLV